MLSRQILLQQARAAYQQGQLAHASDLCHKILRTSKDDVDALAVLHMVAFVQRQGPEAIALAQRIIKAAPNRSTGYFLLADFYVTCGSYREAVSLLNKWLKKSPKDPETILRLAKIHDRQGDPIGAQKLIQPFLDRGDETAEMALLVATIAVQEKHAPRAAALLRKHIDAADVHPMTRKDMCFTMGLACERLGKSDEAFAWYTRGHQTVPYPFNLEGYLELIERMIQTFTPERYARMPRARVNTELPIFLVCRPRSGSTLAERIIASHPQVHLGGELNSITRMAENLNLAIGSSLVYPECVLDLDQNDVDHLAREFMEDHSRRDPKARRITIKHLDLWQHVGLISLVLPQATILDLRRDAVDNCLACYSVHLGARQPYNQDLRTLGMIHRAYERLMDHWQNLGIRMLRIDYEALVADQESWSRTMIEFCGLPWDERCLRFHETAGTTAGTTLSYQQVRQPIYRTSVGRAAKFAKHLGPLYGALGIESPASVPSAG